LVDIGGGSAASYIGGDMEVHHFRGWCQRRVTSEEMIKVSEFVTFKCVVLVKPLGLFRSLPHLMCTKGELCMLFGPSACV
jgi:hypothetical protein